jgi:ferredoxin-like protein FixX
MREFYGTCPIVHAYTKMCPAATYCKVDDDAIPFTKGGY